MTIFELQNCVEISSHTSEPVSKTALKFISQIVILIQVKVILKKENNLQNGNKFQV